MDKKVLIIEDNEQNLYLLKFLLESEGYEVDFADNGIDGIKLASKLTPDIILLDIQLPGMNGYEIAAKLKELKVIENRPIIAVTSYAMVGDKEKALAAGCTGYIEKPINPDTFIQQMNEYIIEDKN